MLLYNCAKKSHCLFHVRIVEFFELFDENIEHRDSNFSFFCFVSIDIFIVFFFLFFIINSLDCAVY